MNKFSAKRIIKSIILEVLNENVNTPLPATLNHLFPKQWDRLPTNVVVSLIKFSKDEGNRFKAYEQAESFLQKRGYLVGTMQSGSPTAFAKNNMGITHIEKWRNIDRDEFDLLNGVIIEEENGDIFVAFFAED